MMERKASVTSVHDLLFWHSDFWQLCLIEFYVNYKLGFPGGSNGKESACNAGDLGLIPGQEDPLEKGMATHSRINAWRIPWTEEPGGLQFTGS